MLLENIFVITFAFFALTRFYKAWNEEAYDEACVQFDVR